MKIALYIIIFFLALHILPQESKAQMYWNHALSTDGSPDRYISFPHNNAIALTGSFTLEAWVQPFSTNGIKPIITKNYTGSYGMAIVNGRVRIYTGNSYRLASKENTVIPLEKWTHIAAVYNAVNSRYEIFINGIADTNSTFAGTPPTSGTDSLYIGRFGPNGFNGYIDEARIWNRSLTANEIKRNFRTSLAVANSKTYAGLVFSLTFQSNNMAGFKGYDWTGNAGTANLVGAGIVTLTNRLLNTVSYNEALELDGTGDYAAAPSSIGNDVTGEFTMEAWVYVKEPSQGSQHQMVIHKRDANNGYSMAVNNQNWFIVVVNSMGAGPDIPFPVKKWTHAAFTLSASGTGKFYMNGEEVFSTTYPLTASTPDSLYIGKSPLGDYFKGYIDEVRISKYEKSPQEIKNYMYRSINSSNDPNLLRPNMIFNFDGSAYTSCKGVIDLSLLGDAKFSAPNTIDHTPVSPLIRNDAGNFSQGYTIKTADRRIPETGTSGLMKQDSLYIGEPRIINDINLFLAANHTFDADMDITLFAPNGDSVQVCLDHYFTTGKSGDLIAIFDDNADSIAVNGIYTSYAPAIKPDNSMNSIFGGDNAQGTWRLKINDDASGDTGRVYAWGLRVNNDAVSITQISTIVPEKHELSQNYPNPFNPVTNIKFNLPVTGMVKLQVYDILGKQVATLVNEVKQAGVYNVDFDGSGLSSGVYFYRLETEAFSDIKKMMLVK